MLAALMATFGSSFGLREENLVQALACIAMKRISLREIAWRNILLRQPLLSELNGIGRGFSGFVL
jgi:hypothetical protein